VKYLTKNARKIRQTIQSDPGREITQQGHTFKFDDGDTYAAKSSAFLVLLREI